MEGDAEWRRVGVNSRSEWEKGKEIVTKMSRKNVPRSLLLPLTMGRAIRSP